MTRSTLARPGQGRPMMRRYLADLTIIVSTLAVVVVVWVLGLWLLHGL